MITPTIDEQSIEIELDTGSAVSIISGDIYQQTFGKTQLDKPYSPANMGIWDPYGHAHMGLPILDPSGTHMGKPIWACPYRSYMGPILQPNLKNELIYIYLMKTNVILARILHS